MYYLIRIPWNCKIREDILQTRYSAHSCSPTRVAVVLQNKFAFVPPFELPKPDIEPLSDQRLRALRERKPHKQQACILFVYLEAILGSRWTPRGHLHNPYERAVEEGWRIHPRTRSQRSLLPDFRLLDEEIPQVFLCRIVGGGSRMSFVPSPQGSLERAVRCHFAMSSC